MPKPKDVRFKQSGFTIIELIVVIVIIGILVTLTMVTYGGVQARSRDTIVKNAAKQLATELLRYSSDTGNTPLQTGGGYNGTGIGWVSSLIVDPNYPVAIETVLTNGGYLPAGFTKGLPANIKYNNSSSSTLMLYGCGSKYVVYYSLEAPTPSDIADFNNNVIPACPDASTVQSSYNMQGGYIFN